MTFAVTAPKAAAGPLPFTGINLSGGEFYGPKPGIVPVYGKNFIYPSPAEFDYFAAKGMNVFRLPFLWETLQPVPDQALNPEEADRLQEVVTGATRKGLTVLLDPHDYARYFGKIIGSPGASNAAFADFWGRLAARFRSNPRVWFGLMNEPHDLPADQWRDAANAAIAAIRKAGAKNLILVPGTAWTGAHSWVSSGNGEAMLGIVDPQQHYLVEVHQYLDADNSGTHSEAVNTTIGSERLLQFTLWCRQHHQRGFLGEFGAADNPIAAQATDDMLTFMERNRDVWVGFTWWSAGPWWGDYQFTLEPKDGKDRPQLAFLLPHLQRVMKSSKKTGIKIP